MTKATRFKASITNCGNTRTRGWYAWNNYMPPKPDDFHVIGEVEVANPGVVPTLTRHVPQGINPAILLLDLILVQQPGVWPMVLAWKHVRYDESFDGDGYSTVQILCNGRKLKSIKVEDIH